MLEPSRRIGFIMCPPEAELLEEPARVEISRVVTRKQRCRRKRREGMRDHAASTKRSRAENSDSKTLRWQPFPRGFVRSVVCRKRGSVKVPTSVFVVFSDRCKRGSRRPHVQIALPTSRPQPFSRGFGNKRRAWPGEKHARDHLVLVPPVKSSVMARRS